MNNDNKSNNTSKAGGVGFLSLLALVFITLKLTGFISWSWLWVLAPIWIPAAIVIGILLIALVVLLVKELVVQTERKRKQAKKAADEDFQRIHAGRIDDVVEEMADVQIMLDQLRIILDRSTDSVEEEKLVRLRARLNERDAKEVARWAVPLMDVITGRKGGAGHE